ncbi:MAG: hypothetical protein V1858_03880 [Candidatus Gottesmanbacteria bacterium]
MKKEILFVRLRQLFWPMLFLMLFLIPIIYPLFKQGMFISDDGEWMIIRFSAFHQALREGQFPVRWLGRLCYEYGYPVANFLYPGFMYLAEIPKILGFSFINSIKIILGFSLISSAVFSYLWLNKFFTRKTAFLGALFYLYAPYHLWDVYKRGSVGEVLALAVVPFILWALEKKRLFIFSLGMAILIVSHNTLALLFLPLIIIYAFFKKTFSTYFLLFATVLGLGLAAFFWIPALYDLQYTRFSDTQVSNFSHFFSSLELLGWPTIIILVISGLTLLPFKYIYHDNIFWLFWLTGISTAFLALPQSYIIWQYIPTNFIQFPFRFLSITIICGAYLIGWIVDRIFINKQRLMISLLGIILLIYAFPYLRPPDFVNKGDIFYTTNEDTTTVQSEYLPLWVKSKPSERPQTLFEINKGRGKIDYQYANSRQIKLIYNALIPIQVKINRFYFPGWYATIDGQKTAISFDNPQGIMIVSSPAGKHSMEIVWRETPIRKLSNLISLLSVGILIIWFLQKHLSPND